MRDYLRGMSKEKFAKAMNDCVDKMEGLNDKDWSEIVSDYDMDISRDCLRKSFTAPLGGYAIYRYMNELNSSDDEKLKEMILSLYRFSMSGPWPEKWLIEKAEAFNISTLEELDKLSLIHI